MVQLQSSYNFLSRPEPNTDKKAQPFRGPLLFLRQWKVYVLPRFRHKTSIVREGEMNKRKLGRFVLAVMLIALGFRVEAQQPKKIPKIAYLAPGTPAAAADLVEAFRQGLRELGYVEGKT